MALKDGQQIIAQKQAQNHNGYFTSEGKYLLSIWLRTHIRHPPVEKLGI
jgi:hypothetical protein